MPEDLRISELAKMIHTRASAIYAELGNYSDDLIGTEAEIRRLAEEIKVMAATIRRRSIYGGKDNG